MVLAIPLIVDGKMALVVYGDNQPERNPIRGVDTLEIFMNQAGMALEKALLEKRHCRTAEGEKMKNVLIVEDSKAIRSMIRVSLEEAGRFYRG